MKYKETSGPINRNKFYWSYSAKLLRDSIDVKQSNFLNHNFYIYSTTNFDEPKWNWVWLTDGTGKILLGEGQKRVITQGYRFRVVANLIQMKNFLDLDFEDYCKLYNINDPLIKTLAALRW